MNKTTRRAAHMLILALIVILMIASIQNIHTRALEVHEVEGVHIWFIAVAMGVSFAFSVWVLMMSRKKWVKVGMIPVVGFAGYVTATMQYGLYMAHGADQATALAWGVGVPVIEAMLAYIDALIEIDARDDTETVDAGTGSWGLLTGAVTNRLVSVIEPQEEVAVDGTSVPVVPVPVLGNESLELETPKDKAVSRPVEAPEPQDGPDTPKKPATPREDRLTILREMADDGVDLSTLVQKDFGDEHGISRVQAGRDIKSVQAELAARIAETNGVVA